MSLPISSKSARNRYRGITEKSKALLFLLREAPYITLKDVQRFFYPTHQTIAYAREMMGVLTRNHFVAKHAMGDNTFIYYLTEQGRRLCEFLLEDKPKFDSGSKTFYYKQKPTRPSEVAAFFVFPNRGLEYFPFTPHYLFLHTFRHTRALTELVVRLRQTYRFRHVLWMDMVKAKQKSLNVSCFPDVLLCNDLTKESGRIYIELENSAAHDEPLQKKIDHLTEHPADWFLFLATSEEIFRNLGTRVRKIFFGQSKLKGKALHFHPRSILALSQKILFGLWEPSAEPITSSANFKATKLYRFDHEIFDARMWVKEVAKKENEPAKGHWQIIPLVSRSSGIRERTLGSLLDGYQEACMRALERDMT